MNRLSRHEPQHDRWMARALELAADAMAADEVPVGALVVSEQGVLLGEGFNQPILSNDPTAHAEIVALRRAAQTQANYRLTGCTLYVTIEPCTMCVGAAVHARIATLVLGAREPKAGAVFSHPEVLANSGLNHEITVIEGIRQAASAQLMQDFFGARRLSSTGKRP